MRVLYWIVVIGALLLSGASAFLFFGETNMDAEALARAKFDAELAAASAEAETGGAAAQYRLAKTLLDAPDDLRDPGGARVWLRKAAEQGHIDAQFELGVLFARGDGVPQSYHRAADWLRLAAGLGRHREAQFRLGDMYFHGRGVPQDYGAALGWFLKAAERGHPVAQYVIGVMYAEGWGVEVDNIEAYKWLTLALPARDRVRAYDSNQDPQAVRETLLLRMNQSQIDLARKKLAAWKSAQ